MNKNLLYILSFFISFIGAFLFTNDFYASIGIGLFIFFSTKLFYDIGKKIEIRDIIITIASLQWIIGPFLSYTFYPDNQFYFMAVDRGTYMSFAVPATLFFAIGMFLPIWKNKKSNNFYLEELKELLNKYKNLDIIFIILGSIFYFYIDYAPISIKFAIFIISGIRFVGLFLLFISKRKHRIILVFIIIGWFFLITLRETIFHEFIIWMLFFIFVVSFITKPKLRTKVIYSLSLVLLVIVIQTVKYKFRQEVQNSENRLSLFTKLVSNDILESNTVTSENNLEAMVVRINQGWIIARIMYWTPSREPFANGETILASIKESLIPRFLDPNKTISAGGRTYFTRFTGKLISDNTSMGLGLLGEAYANYGILGGSVFMFIIGLFYNFVLFLIFKISIKHPLLIFFIPLIFLQVIKAETDFSVILNHLVKSSLFVFVFFIFVNKFLNVKI